MDNDLAPCIAKALRLFSYDILHIQEVAELSPDSSDPEIFNWCSLNGRTWITHDIEAKTKHASDLKKSRISVLWVRGHPKNNANWFFFKMIVKEIDKFHEKLQRAHGAIHYRVTRRGLIYMWAELEFDRKKENLNS